MRAYDVYHASNGNCHREQFITFSTQIRDFSNLNTKALTELQHAIRDNLPLDGMNIKRVVSSVKHAYKKWTTIQIEDYVVFSTPVMLKVPTYKDPFKSSPSMQISVELSRAVFVINFTQIIRETSQFTGRAEPTLDIKRASIVLWTLDMMPGLREAQIDTKRDSIWGKPIIKFTQAEIMEVLFFITGELSVMSNSRERMGEFCTVTKLIHIRIGMFNATAHSHETLNAVGMATAIPNTEDAEWVASRDFHFFCTIYMNVLVRRAYYHNLMQTMDPRDIPSEETMASVRSWFLQKEEPTYGIMALGVSSEDCFQDTYALACVDAYYWSYDDEWFAHLHPNNPINSRTRGHVVDSIRPHLSKGYYYNACVGPSVITGAVEWNNFQGHLSRYFIMHVFDYHMRTRYTFQWRDTCVISNESIESQSIKMQKTNWGPLLVQFVSRYWVYSRGLVYRTDSIYNALATWCHLVLKDYNGVIFNQDVGDFMREILKGTNHVDIQRAFILPP